MFTRLKAVLYLKSLAYRKVYIAVIIKTFAQFVLSLTQKPRKQKETFARLLSINQLQSLDMSTSDSRGRVSSKSSYVLSDMMAEPSSLSLSLMDSCSGAS